MQIIELLKIIFFGIVEGVTEWLPISSTGHLILLEELIKMNVSDSFMEMFRVVIQLGAIMAVVVLYFNKLNPFSIKKSKQEQKDTWSLWFKVIIACIPAVVFSVFEDIIDKVFYNWFVVALTLIIYGILFIIIENKNKEKKAKVNNLNDMSYKLALIIGLFQVLAIIPGTSRSGSTIIGAIIFGASRTVAAEFTFFLGIPVMFGASLLKILKFGLTFTGVEIVTLLIGMLVAFIVSILVIKFLMNYIKKHNFKAFGWYRIILGIVVLLYFLIFT